MRRVFTLDFGDSYVTGQPVLPQLAAAMVRSAKLAGLALLLTIPIAIAAGIFAARRRDKVADRVVVMLGVASSSIPEFVTGTILVVVVGRPAEAVTGPRDAATQCGHPDDDPLPADAGDGDGDRLLRLHRPHDQGGRDRRPAIRLHPHGDDEGPVEGPGDAQARPAQRAHPDDHGHRVQVGYLFGGIIGVEKIFNYHGIGSTMLFAAQQKDIPVLTAGAIVIGIVYMIATLPPT